MLRFITVLGILIQFSYSIFSQDTYTVNSIVTDIPEGRKSKGNVYEKLIIPFELIGGLILVDAEINGKASNCIIDTGAPSLVINKKEALIESESGVAIGITGEQKMRTIIVEEFSIGDLKKQNVDAIELDISHLSLLKQLPIDGIIGVDTYKEDQILIDYKSEEIEILPRNLKKYDALKMITSVSFFMEDQLPVIQVNINNKSYFFGVDTGAEVNVIDKGTFEKTGVDKMVSRGEKILSGVDHTKTLAQTVLIDNIKIKKQTFDEMEFVMMDLKNFNKNLTIKLDGLLGFPFLKENLISFDFRKSKIRFWKKK